MPKAKRRGHTIKETNWLNFFFKTGNKRAASKKAYNIGGKGGSKTKKGQNNTADRIGQKVAAKLQGEIDRYYKKQKINVDWVLKRLVIKADHSGDEKLQIRCIEDIGKHLKMFTDKIELETTGKVEHVNVYVPDNKRNDTDKGKEPTDDRDTTPTR